MEQESRQFKEQSVKKPFNWKLIYQLENEAFEEYRQSRLADDFLRKLDQTQYGQIIHGWCLREYIDPTISGFFFLFLNHLAILSLI